MYIYMKGMATKSSILVWRILRTEKPGRPQSMGSKRVRHDRETSTHTRTHTPIQLHGHVACVTAQSPTT